MKILLATGIYPPDVGGIATYAENLSTEFFKKGYSVKVLSYSLEKKLPIGVRHFWYFCRVVFNLYNTDMVLALDTFSTGLPAVIASKIFGKKILVRLGGDFLWESYVERTGDLVPLPLFYQKTRKSWNLKERIIFSCTKFLLNNADVLVFSTEWQKKIFMENYPLVPEKIKIIENFYGKKDSSIDPVRKNFVFAGRSIKLKNQDILVSAFMEAQKESGTIFLDIVEKISHKDLMEKIKNCYAVILPSVSDISPNLILEAIKFNKPFIMTKYNGLSERISDVSVFVDPLDERDIKEKILFLTKDENYDEYKKRIENFNFSHSWQEIADEFLDIYKKI